MEKQRQIKLLSIVTLVVAIIGMTLGFAAFSTTLTISSSATVTPSSDDFKITIYGIKDSSFYDTFADNNYAYTDSDISDSYGTALMDGATGTIASIDNVSHTISNINASFSNEGNVQYAFIIKNEGMYDAYIDLSEFIDDSVVSGMYKPTCVGDEGATETLVDAACNGLNLLFTIIDKETGDSKIITDSTYKIPVNSDELFAVIINYEGPYPDGKFEATFPNIELKFSTTK